MISILIGLSGCVAPILPPVKISPTPPFNFRNGKALKMRTTQDPALIRRPRIIYINPVSFSENVKASASLSNKLKNSLREYYYRALIREIFKDTMIIKEGNLEWYDDKENRIMILDLTVTHLKKGNGLLRYFIGFGLGQSDLQIEGRLYDHQTSHETIAFAFRSRHAGNSYQGLNPRALSAKYCLQMSEQEAAISTSKLIRDIWQNIDRTGMAEPLHQIAWER